MTSRRASRQPLINSPRPNDTSRFWRGIETYLADPAPGSREIAPGITLDVAAAVLAHPYSVEVLAREAAPEAQRRMAVRTAILLARSTGDVSG